MVKLGTPLTPPTRKIRLILELRRSGITDTSLLSAFEKVPRELFVPETFADQAWENTPLPIGRGQTISQPMVVARMIQALLPADPHNILEVGCGSGYQTAVLSHLFRRVFAVERQMSLFREATERLAKLRRYNVTAKPGDGSMGWPEQAPFDRILVAAAAEDIPPLLWDQLAPGGTMVCPVGEIPGEQRLLRIRRLGAAREIEDLGPVRFVPLVGGRDNTVLKGACLKRAG
jgi:protein-L-isoaspartate(D-aspartate) O-methyltransferase